MALTLDDLFWDDEVDDFPQPDWLIRGVIPKESFIQLAGRRSSKKTFLALDMAYHIALGIDWHGKYKVNQGLVVFVSGEGRGGTKNRNTVWKLHNKEKLKDKRAGVMLINRPVSLLDEKEIQSLIKFVYQKRAGDKGKPALFIFDTLNVCSSGADESSSKDMGLIIDNIKKIMRGYPGCSVLLVHHPGHETGKRGRGHSSLTGALDVEIFLSSKNNYVTAECHKQKDADEFEPIQFTTKKYVLKEETEDESEQSSLVVDQITKPGETLMVARFGAKELQCWEILQNLVVARGYEGVSQGEWTKAAEEVSISKSTVSRLKDKLIEDGLVVVKKGLLHVA